MCSIEELEKDIETISSQIRELIDQMEELTKFDDILREIDIQKANRMYLLLEKERKDLP